MKKTLRLSVAWTPTATALVLLGVGVVGTGVVMFRGYALAGLVGSLAALITAGVVLLTNTRASDAVSHKLAIAAEATELGLVACIADSTVYDYTGVLCDSRKLVVVLNDGRTWCSVHRDRLRRRLQDTSKETTVFLIHPESEMIPVLARKGSIEPESLKNKIRETLALLDELCVDGSRLEILGHHLFNPHSLVLTETRALLMPYFTSRGGRTVPLFVFEDAGPGSFYGNLVEDVEALRMDADQIGRSTRGGRSGLLQLHDGSR